MIDGQLWGKNLTIGSFLYKEVIYYWLIGSGEGGLFPETRQLSNYSDLDIPYAEVVIWYALVFSWLYDLGFLTYKKLCWR